MSFKGLLIGVSGLQSQSKKMEVIGNNLANINTTGFKKGEVSFKEMFADVLRSGSAGSGDIGGTNPATIGNGVTVSSIANVFTQGAKNSTARALDFMIEGEDFFVSKNGSDGSLMLTRDGSFQLDGDFNLVDSFGNKVQGFSVDRESGEVAAQAGDIQISQASIAPSATTNLEMEANIDASASKSLIGSNTNAWELFSSGDNFGKMQISVPGGAGSRSTYGTGFYQDSIKYQDSAATMAAGLTDITLSASPASLIEGFAVGDTVNLIQGSNQVQRTISAINTGTRTITVSTAAPGTFSAGTVDITNASDGMAVEGTSGSTLTHNDVLRSQVSIVDQDGKLISSFYRVAGNPSQYTRATANVAGGGTITVGTGEFSNMQELVEGIELALRDSQLTNYSASTDLDVSMDKFGQVTFGGTGLVRNFRMVINADNTEMLDRFSGIAMTDAGAVATTQARVDASGEVIAPPALGLGARSTNSSKWWFNASGIQNYGYSGTTPGTEYGEFAGLHLDGGADGSGFGLIQLSTTNALGNSVSRQFKLVARDPDSNNNEFSTMGELAQILQNTLRSDDFSSIAVDGVLQGDQSATVSIANGRLNVATTNGLFNNLKVETINKSAVSSLGVTKSDDMNFGTVLGALSRGVHGKSGTSNQFIEADVISQTQVHDTQGNEHTAVTYFVRDRSSGLVNIEWKYKNGLNANLNTFSSEVADDKTVYANTFNSVQDTNTSSGVIGFDIDTGKVLGANASGSDSRYTDKANLTFLANTDSQEADLSKITLDFNNLTSYNGDTTVIGHNIDGYAMGNLVRLTTEQNTGNINGVYSNGKIRTLAKIGLMSIANPEGLQKVGSSYYIQSPSSSRNGNTKGLDQVFAVAAQAPASGDSVNSKIHGNSLEASNVDLTEELTEMITTQRSYSAGGKIITTSDEMLQEALNLKR